MAHCDALVEDSSELGPEVLGMDSMRFSIGNRYYHFRILENHLSDCRVYQLLIIKAVFAGLPCLIYIRLGILFRPAGVL